MPYSASTRVSADGIERASSSASEKGNRGGAVGKILPLVVVAVGMMTLWKLVKTCSIRVHPKCVTVVYETRRRSILSTSADRDMKRQGLPRVTHFSPLLYLSGLAIYSNSSLVIVPPSSFFGTFTLPKSVFEEPGESVDCAVEDVCVSDGAVDMVLTINYVIPFQQLERYLTAVGPQPPNEVIGIAAADVARVRCSDLSVGILISKSRREAVFMAPFRAHLASKLMSEAAVRLVDVIVENVELIEGA